MNTARPNYLVIALPMLIMAVGVLLWGPPLWLGMLLIALCAFVPPCLYLHQQTTRQAALTQQILDGISHPVYVKDAQSRYTLVNRAFCEACGLTTAHIIGRTTQDIAQNTSGMHTALAEDIAALDGQPVRAERHDIHPKNGGERHYLVMKSTYQDQQGNAFIVGADFDITRWWVTEQDLLQELQLERTQYQHTFAFVQRVMDLIPHPVYVKDADGYCVLANRAMVMETSLAAQRTTRASSEQGAEDAKREQAEDQAVLQGSSVFREARDVDAESGAIRARIISKGSCLDARGDRVIVGVQVDLSELRQTEHKLQLALENEVALRERTHAFIQRLIDVIPDPVFIKKAGGRYQMVNEAFAQYRNIDKLGFKAFDPPVTAHDIEKQRASLQEDDEVLAGLETEKEDHTIRQSTGEEVFRIISKRRSIYVDGDPVVVGVERHISRWRIAERELKRLAEEDALTGIANRRHFDAESRRAIELAHRHSEELVILMFDLDHFKLINDQYGHTVGDEVLREMSRRMQICFRKSDLPGRWGGEEFIAVLPHTTAHTAQEVAERLRARLANEPIATSCGFITVTLSGGGAQLRHDDTLESLVARADAALYRAKHGGRNRIEMMQNEINETLSSTTLGQAPVLPHAH